MPEEIKAHFSPQAEWLHRLGFRGTLYHCIEDPLSRTTYYLASFLHTSGGVIARLEYRIFQATTPPRRFDCCTFLSRLNDGLYVATTSSKTVADRVERLSLESHPKANVEQLWEIHRERLRSPQLRAPIVKIRDGQHLLDSLEEVHRMQCDDLVERKVFLPLEGEEEIPETEAVISSADDSLLVSEVRQIERKAGASSKAMLLTLAISLLLFVAAGGFTWDWKFTLLLVPILLFHEAGHFLAMKLFDYQNVRMFFVPFFGAAVAGKHFNVPGWKRIVTSLMGPVPGILLGTGLGIVALLRDNELLLTAAILTLFINGLNLLPVLPLDGGWVVHGLLFSRHAFLDFLFRLLAIGTLILVGSASGDYIFLGLGVAMAVGLPASFHAARITDRLRSVSDFPTDALDGQVPAEAIDRIGTELDKAYPKGLGVRAKAKWVLHIFENINSRPPGWVGTLSLGGVYLASLAAVVVAGSLLFVGKYSDIGRLALEAGLGPQTPLQAEQIVSVPAQLDLASLHSDKTLVMQFGDREQAEAALAAVQAELLPEERLLLMGNSLMLLLADNADEERTNPLFDRYDTKESPAFFHTSDSGTMIALSFIAPNPQVAERLTDDLNAFFAIPGSLNPVPPWHPSRQLTESERLVRRTVIRLTNTDWMDDVAEEGEFYESIAEARRRGQHDVVKRLSAERKQIFDAAFQDHLGSLKALPPDQIDHTLIAAFEKSQRQAEQHKGAEGDDGLEDEELNEFYSHFPVLPDSQQWLQGHKDSLGLMGPEDPWREMLQINYGTANPNGLFLSFTAQLKSLAPNFVRIIQWLEEQDCVDFKYTIFQPF